MLTNIHSTLIVLLSITVCVVIASNRRENYRDEWTPVGKSDPFRGPTFDYQPPVLERVRYWADGTTHKDKSDVLLLGVPGKKIHDGQEKFQYGQIKRNHMPLKKYPSRYAHSAFHHMHPHPYSFSFPIDNVPAPSHVKEAQFNYMKNPAVRFPDSMSFFRPHINNTIEVPPHQGTVHFKRENVETSTEDFRRSTLHAALLAESFRKPVKNPILFPEVYSPQMINSLAIPTFESENKKLQTTTKVTTTSTTTEPPTQTVPSTTLNYLDLKIITQDPMVRPARLPYLIIEGHSKVKTYGKDEALSKYLPKIRSITSEDPVVRNTPENSPEYQIKLVSKKPKNYQDIFKNSLEKFFNGS